MIALRYPRRSSFSTSAVLAAGLVASLPGCVSLPAAKAVGGMVSTPERSLDGVPAPVPTIIPLTMDNNRLYAEVSFRKADGGVRKAMAWVNFGMGGLSLSPSLRRDLGPEGSVAFSLGSIPVIVQPGAILPADADDFAQLGPFPVEAILPAALWPHYRVTLDYAARSLTLAQPSPVPAPRGGGANRGERGDRLCHRPGNRGWAKPSRRAGSRRRLHLVARQRRARLAGRSSRLVSSGRCRRAKQPGHGG